jgi:hypothetical protein
MLKQVMDVSIASLLLILRLPRALRAHGMIEPGAAMMTVFTGSRHGF